MSQALLPPPPHREKLRRIAQLLEVVANTGVVDRATIDELRENAPRLVSHIARNHPATFYMPNMGGRIRKLVHLADEGKFTLADLMTSIIL